MKLGELKDTTRKDKSKRRVGRGVGCSKGKTCGKGEKGDKARSGYKRRAGQEGGQAPRFTKVPIRGFPNARFRKEKFAINLDRIEALYEDGETLNKETLHAKGYTYSKLKHGIKVLGNGELKKKVRIEADCISNGAMQKLEKAKIEFKIIK